MKHVELNYLAPITSRHGFSLREGVLTLEESVEYMASGKTIAKIRDLTVDKMHVDDTHTVAQPAPGQAATKAPQKTRQASNMRHLEFHLDRMMIRNCEMGIINKMTASNNRLFFTRANVTLTTLSDQSREGASTLEATGQFMGTGKTTITGTFRPATSGPYLEGQVAIAFTQTPAINDMFQAYATFDVAAGEFSLYSELTVTGKAI